ncbi:MAG TPA: hypothetical protein VK689_09275, partial [Armatimonadota bacterium]|nr:hypothetical protein [Armatimonadota bacterium]
MRLLLVLWTPLLLAGLLASAATAIEGGPENKVPRVLESEPRLERRVTLSERRIYLGELLERISAQTGTHLKADDRSAPISGYQVTVTVWDQPARDVLDALARLYSAPPDRWFWAKEGRDGEERYVLHNTLPATQVDSVHEASVEEYVLSEHQRLRGFYSLPPERRAALAATDPALRALSDPLAEMHFSFVSSLSSSEVRAILWGKRLSLPASRLTPAQVNYLREWWGIAGPVEDEGDEEREAGQKVSLWRTGAHDPSITLLVGSTEVGTALSGVGLPRKLRARSQQAWLAADERKDISARRGAVPRGKIRHEDLHVVNLTLDTITHRLGRLGRVNLLFDCPPWIDSQRDTLEQNMIGPLPDLLQAVEGLGVTWKRRGEFYLLRKADTETVRRTLPTPWPLPRTLRASAKAN